MRYKKNIIISIIVFMILILLFVGIGKKIIINNKFNNKENKESLYEIYKLSSTLSPFINDQNIEELNERYREVESKLKKCDNYKDLYFLHLELLASIKDNHSFLITSEELSENIGYLPVEFLLDDGNIYIKGVGFENTNLKKGAKLIKYNNLSVEDLLKELEKYSNSTNEEGIAENINLIRIGNLGEDIKLTFLNPGGSTQVEKIKFIENYSISIRPPKNLIYSDEIFWLYESNGMKVLKIYNFKDDNFKKSFFNNVLPLLKNTDEIIIDVRDNSGGNASNGLLVLNCISDYKEYNNYDFIYRKNLLDLSEKYKSRKSEESAHEVVQWIENLNIEKDDFYKTNVVNSELIRLENQKNGVNIKSIYILSSKNTVSAGEDFIFYSKQNPSIKIIGEKTKGATGQVFKFNLKNKNSFFLTLYKCEMQNKPVNNIGIEPDYYWPKNKSINELTRELKNIK